MYPIKLIVLSGTLLFFTSVCEGKKRCKPLLEKLHNIQAMQRNGYTSKQGVNLRSKEDKARNLWWQCEQGRGKKDKQRRKSKHKGQNKSRYDKTNFQQGKSSDISAGSPFKTNNVVVIKSKYQGSKKQAWLKYYQQPAHCNRPKTLAVFASCSEDKQAQRMNFEQEY